MPLITTMIKFLPLIVSRNSKSHPTLRNIHTRMLKENPIEVSQYKAPILSNQEQTDFGQESADDAGYASGLEDGGQPTVDELEEINLGDETDQRPIFIAKSPPGIPFDCLLRYPSGMRLFESFPDEQEGLEDVLPEERTY
ncbi:hypothetical protein Dimus_036931 [Dionaea muscipula]